MGSPRGACRRRPLFGTGVCVCFFLSLCVLPTAVAIYCGDKECYSVLDLSTSATPSEIKKAYYKLSLQWHPDKNPAPEATARFREISNSYEILSDVQSKADYDELLAHPERRAAHYYNYYAHTYTRQHLKIDVRALLAALLVVVSVCQHVYATTHHAAAVAAVKKNVVFRNRARALALEMATEAAAAAAAAKAAASVGPLKRPKPGLKSRDDGPSPVHVAAAEAVLLSRMTLNNRVGPPVWTDCLLPQMVLVPVAIARSLAGTLTQRRARAAAMVDETEPNSGAGAREATPRPRLPPPVIAAGITAHSDFWGELPAAATANGGSVPSPRFARNGRYAPPTGTEQPSSLPATAGAAARAVVTPAAAAAVAAALGRVAAAVNRGAGSAWSPAEELALLKALKAFPKDGGADRDRWGRIAAAVPGRRTGPECQAHVAVLRQTLKQASLAEATANT